MQIPYKMRHDFLRAQSSQRTSDDVLKEGGGEWHGPRDDEAVGGVVEAFCAGGVGGAAEDCEAPDGVVFEGPGLRVWVEVAEEDVDGEGLVEAVLFGAEVGDVFCVGVCCGEGG